MSQERTTYSRFDKWQRLEHIVLLISFTVLAITGLPQKFADMNWAVTMIDWMGGIELVRIIHRIAAIVLMIGTIYHAVVVSYKIAVRRVRMTMLPGWQDAKDAIQMLAYNVGVKKEPAKMHRYTFGEKAEYWAVVWGTVIMVITGFMLWNPIATAKFLPGQFIPAAKAAHGAEALLAVLSILTWHFYNVHLKVFNKSMFTGRISRHEMEEEHPLELAEFEAGRMPRQRDPAALQRRKRIFYPVATIITLALVIGLYVFVTLEDTAIETVPRQTVEVYVPGTPEP